jgi:hypothetical protein
MDGIHPLSSFSSIGIFREVICKKIENVEGNFF